MDSFFFIDLFTKNILPLILSTPTGYCQICQRKSCDGNPCPYAESNSRNNHKN